MIRYELYMYNILYLATTSSDKAFTVFRRFTGKGHDMKMKFVRVDKRSAA